nr:hypothetical protein [Tanacetum cinerariifolium]
MVLDEEDQVEKFIGGLFENIQGKVIVVEPTRLQDAIRIANYLMDQKLKGYAVRNAKNKRRFKNNSRDFRSFMSTAFSVLLEIVPSTLDISYAVEQADERIA